MDANRNKTAATGPTFLNMGLLITGFMKSAATAPPAQPASSAEQQRIIVMPDGMRMSRHEG
jgi:hypothetical protein